MVWWLTAPRWLEGKQTLYIWMSCGCSAHHYSDVIMSTTASQITSLMIVYSTVCSDADPRKHQSSASLAFVRLPVNFPHKEPVTRKMFSFDDIITIKAITSLQNKALTQICRRPVRTFAIVYNEIHHYTCFLPWTSHFIIDDLHLVIFVFPLANSMPTL